LGAVIKAKLTTNGGDYAAQNARYDWNTLGHFASINETGGYGVTLSNQDCYFMNIGNSTITSLDESSAQLKILAGGQIDGFGIPNQGGDNIFSQRFAITTHANYNAAAEMKAALAHQDSMVCGMVFNPVNFLLPTEYSFVKNTAGINSIIYAVKPTEDLNNRGITARVWNLGNSDDTATINYNLDINEARRMTHVETDLVDVVNFIGKDLFLPIGHNEMKTLRVKLNVIPLPVKLITFTGDKVQEFNELQWKATDEINLKNYELQRSTNGQQFITISNTVAKTGTLNNYNYTDKDINATLPYYYRLKMINSDNTFSYSATIIIKAAKGADDLMVFPNPATDIVKVNLILDKQTRCSVSVINAAGVVVKTVAPPLFERGTNYYTLPIKNLPTGEYILSITAGDKKFAKSFIKK
jgi:Secretion system C-terminal sorting domain